MSKKRISELDGLRVIAALGVVWIHSWTFCGNPGGWHSIYRAFAILGNGVDFFFVISGFFMYMIFYKKKFSLSTYGEFILKRWKRIAPAFYVSAACYCLLFLLKDSHYPIVRSFLINASFLNNIFPRYEIIGPYWSLSTEWQFYMVMPFLFYVSSKRYFYYSLATCSVLSILFFYVVNTHYINYDYWERQVISRFVEFGWGILAANLYVNKVKLPAIFSKQGGAWIGLIICLAGRVMMMTEFYSHLGALSVVSRTLSIAVMTFGFAMICYNVITGTTVFSRLLATRPMQYIGRISYSIYLWHSLVIFLMGGVLVKFQNLPVYPFWVFLVVSCFTILLSAVSYKLLEASYFKSGLPEATRQQGPGVAGKTTIVTE
jgi:peptidoglycan/LPS O-acetylase OafA/YrhL